MKRKRKIGILIGCLAVVMVGMFPLFHEQKKTEIVWYLYNPRIYGIDSSKLEPYQKLESKRFEKFNERLKELKIPAKVIFKYFPHTDLLGGETVREWTENNVKDSGTYLKTLEQKDPEADIIYFSRMQFQQFIELDSYFENQEMKKAKKAISDKIWKANEIQGKTYQIPRGNKSIMETTYCFRKNFLKDYGISLPEEEVRQMNPKEVIEWLLSYFPENHVLDGKYYLTSASELFYQNYFEGKKISLIEGQENSISMLLDTKKVQGNLSEGMDLYEWIYRNNIDAHNYQGQLQPVFCIGNIPEIEELQGKKSGDAIWKTVRLGNPRVCSSVGNGVLKSSKKKELAVQVLAASVYDAELSNLMIHGIEGEDYHEERGYAVYTDKQRVSMSDSFSQIGNNLIAYPSEAEVIDKKEQVEALLEQIPIIPYSNFVPDWSDEKFLEMAAKIAGIGQETKREASFFEIPDMKAYLEEQEKKQKEAGIDELLVELQKQADTWEE